MKRIYIFFLILLTTMGCNPANDDLPEEANSEKPAHHQEIHLSNMQFQSLGIVADTLPVRIMSGYIETNGQLTLPPQSQASVTSIIGANIASIEVIEGNKVKQGQVLAYLYHPDIIALQTEYASQVNHLEYLEQEYKRQERLYNESVGSGRDFQRAKADYHSMKGMVEGIKAQLKLLFIDPDAVKNGIIFDKIPLKSPITGYIQQITVRTGQYAPNGKTLFEIIRNDHIHAHFKVFENDVPRLKEGQLIDFIVESQPDIIHQAAVFAVGKMFDNNTKAVNVHAELNNENESLLPGMYVRGRIIMDGQPVFALPEKAVAMDGNRYYIFVVSKIEANGESLWRFMPMEITAGVRNDSWIEIKLHEPLPEDVMVAWNNAYYLLAELRKDDAGHEH